MRATLITGCCGFIGFHASIKLMKSGVRVVGFDNLNDYYDVDLKRARLEILLQYPTFTFIKGDLVDEVQVKSLFSQFDIGDVVHLAAQAGVRHSIKNPLEYGTSNLLGFVNILEESKKGGVGHFVYASSSSVYGLNSKAPFREDDDSDHPISLYSATKRANEIMAHSYSHLFGLPTTGLRFFTVYGPWGRPDMSPIIFARAIFEEKYIDVFNQGDMWRDFTSVHDVVEIIFKILQKKPVPAYTFNAHNPPINSSSAPWRIFNVGNSRPVKLLEYIDLMGRAIGKPVNINLLPLQPGDLVSTYADTTLLNEYIDYVPMTSLAEGLPEFVRWVKSYYNY